MGKWTRRAFVGAGGLLGGGLALGVGGVLLAPNRLSIRRDGERAGVALTTWIRITAQNEVIALVPHCEMGQGAQMGLAMMLAEELEADFASVRIEEAPAESAYANGYFLRGFAEDAGLPVPGWLERAMDYGTYKVADIASFQITGNSSSIRSTGQYGLRIAGAVGKAMLLDAAAERWGVARSDLVARDSVIGHTASGRSASFAELASDAANMKIPAHPALKARSDYRIVGLPQPRRDLPSKIDGSAVYGIDFDLPDLRYAAIEAAPVPGGLLESIDRDAALALPGVEAVVELDNAVAVVASGFWQASEALKQLAPRFSDAERGGVTSEQLERAHAQALDDAGFRFEGGGRLEAEYRVPYLAHATMEPMAATARFADGRLEVWAGTQDPLNARRVAARAAGLDLEQVRMHNLPLGGGFGRRLPDAFDYVEQAVRIAEAVSPRAVKLIWGREEDMRHDFYRPLVVARLSATLDPSGRPETWHSWFTGGRLDMPAATPIYAHKSRDIRAVDPPVHLRTGFWRSVEHSQHAFFVESFIEELSYLAGEDPLDYRLALLSEKPRHRAVLERVAEMAAWSKPTVPGRARGLAIVECFGSIVAEVAEVSVDDLRRIRVHRVDACVDCGFVVDPGQARAQIEGGIVFGLAAALLQEITVDDGAVVQGNFTDFEMIRLADAPRVSIEFVESDAALGGLGEPGVPPVAPAVANALFALTGERLRTLPFRLAFKSSTA